MQISLVCIIARDRADHSSNDRSVPAVDLPRPSSAARQGGNDGGKEHQINHGRCPVRPTAPLPNVGSAKQIPFRRTRKPSRELD